MLSQQEFAEAEVILRAVAEQVPDGQAFRKLRKDVHLLLANCRRLQGDFSEAADFYAAMAEDSKPEPVDHCLVRQHQARALMASGRLGEAALALDLAMQASGGVPGADEQRLLRIETLTIRGNLLRSQRRLKDAEAALHSALELWEGLREKRLPVARLLRANCHSQYALLCADGERDGAPRDANQPGYDVLAKRYYLLALDFFQQQRPGSFETASVLYNYARFLHVAPKRPGAREPNFEEAGAYYRRALAIYESRGAAALAETADTRRTLALLAFDQQQHDRAKELLSQAADEASRLRTPNLEVSARIHYLMSRVLWELGDRTGALAELEVSLNLALEQRSRGGGASFDRARYFTLLTSPIERSIEWRCELANASSGEEKTGHIAAALLAIEQSKGLSIEEERRYYERSPLKEVSENLRRREQSARQEVSDAVRSWLFAGAKEDALAKYDLVRNARENHLSVTRQVWNASRGPQQPAARSTDEPLKNLREWAQANDSLVLEYFVGAHGVYVVALDAEGESIEKLPLGPEELRARISGPNGVRRLLCGESGGPDAGEATRVDYSRVGELWRRLYALWRDLIPEPVRKRLLDEDNAYRRLAIIPDDALSKAPFDALVWRLPEELPADQPVTEALHDEVCYLLDLPTPLFYASSAAQLKEAAEQGIAAEETHPLLVVDPRYVREEESAEDFRLQELDNAGLEAGLFQRIIGNLKTLSRDEATEENLRKAIAESNWLIFSGHGMAEPEPGYLSCFLAVSPGDTTAPEDDGMLDISELSVMALSGYELVLLCACQSNSGVGVRGEGVWSVARGFQVAGANRLIATSWSVANDSTRCITEFLLEAVMDQKADNQPRDFAAALHEAKGVLRAGLIANNPEFSHPYHWAGFALIGAP